MPWLQGPATWTVQPIVSNNITSYFSEIITEETMVQSWRWGKESSVRGKYCAGFCAWMYIETFSSYLTQWRLWCNLLTAWPVRSVGLAYCHTVPYCYSALLWYTYIFYVLKNDTSPLLPDCATSAPWRLLDGQTAFEMWWHTRRNQISSFGETDESI